jgi:hypothetical protein
MDKIYTLSDTIKLDKKNKVAVSELVEQKGEIFNLIKNGLQFDDEVLEKAHIKKTIRDVRGYCGIYSNEKEKKINLPKDTKNVKSILKSINTIEQENLDEHKTSIRQPDSPELVDEENEEEI